MYARKKLVSFLAKKSDLEIGDYLDSLIVRKLKVSEIKEHIESITKSARIKGRQEQIAHMMRYDWS